jgi:hypothetical protein
MELLLSHWHCILPAAVIILGMFLLNRDKSKVQQGDRKNGSDSNYDEEI